MVTVSKVPDLVSLIDEAATRFVDTVSAIQADSAGGVGGDGIARVVVTGGTAGIGLLEKLATVNGVNWSQIYIFFGDERNVAVSHPDSNEGQARAALFDHVEIPDEHIFGYGLGTADLEQASADYEQLIVEKAPQGFDIHLLGMGYEGHINSLFPHSSAVAENERLVVAVTDSPKPPSERSTLTLPAVSRAQRVWLLVNGEDKAEAAGRVAHGADSAEWPAAGAHGVQETILFVSESAATQI
ncbi:6-phosphogluconolactonase [Corynebacterium lubricantis]|uniref:6-phosphogluconolactonase n=1 Tax=Corynebacterium lubricantis TaxID=541095 RepID=UPI000361EF27|nr:6-phosphogluconolactonase [Corynebacterium lubricantis]